MEVTLLSYTPEPEKTVAAAARLCYSPLSGGELLENFDDEQVQIFLARLSSQGHYSPFEHASFTFAIDGVSRALSHQLVRHRIASFSQKSQRYVAEDSFAYVTPPAIAANKEHKRAFEHLMREIMRQYTAFLADGIAAEDARYILPNAVATNLVLTMNARSLLNFFRLRCCLRAQAEIRQLAQLMLAEVKLVAPALFTKAGPSCEAEGICYEGNMNCGQKQAVVRSRQENPAEKG
jgi:thymidylate synthase (FAD)